MFIVEYRDLILKYQERVNGICASVSISKANKLYNKVCVQLYHNGYSLESLAMYSTYYLTLSDCKPVSDCKLMSIIVTDTYNYVLNNIPLSKLNTINALISLRCPDHLTDEIPAMFKFIKEQVIGYVVSE